MFERFTDRARRVVTLSQEEARLLSHNYIGTEHILLGLVHESEGVAGKALEALGIKLDEIRTSVEEKIGRGADSPPGHIPFTPRAKRVLELSLREALQLGHNYIGTEHILLGLVREGEGVAAQVLIERGAELAMVRQKVIQLLSGYSEVKAEAARQHKEAAGRSVAPRQMWNLLFQDLKEVCDWLQDNIVHARSVVDKSQRAVLAAQARQAAALFIHLASVMELEKPETLQEDPKPYGPPGS